MSKPGSIKILKDEVGVKFYLGGEIEPSAIIYDGNDLVVIKNEILVTPEEVTGLSELIALSGVFLESIQALGEDKRSRKLFDVTYVNTVIKEEKEAKYTPKQVLRRMYSNKIITVNKKKRIRFQFLSFRFNNNRIIINYNPVIW